MGDEIVAACCGGRVSGRDGNGCVSGIWGCMRVSWVVRRGSAAKTQRWGSWVRYFASGDSSELAGVYFRDRGSREGRVYMWSRSLPTEGARAGRRFVKCGVVEGAMQGGSAYCMCRVCREWEGDMRWVLHGYGGGWRCSARAGGEEDAQ